MTTPNLERELEKEIKKCLYGSVDYIHHNCGINADPADGFGRCTCEIEEKLPKELAQLFAQHTDRAVEKVLPEERPASASVYSARDAEASDFYSLGEIRLQNEINKGFNQCIAEIKDRLARIKSNGGGQDD